MMWMAVMLKGRGGVISVSVAFVWCMLCCVPVGQLGSSPLSCSVSCGARPA